MLLDPGRFLFLLMVLGACNVERAREQPEVNSSTQPAPIDSVRVGLAVPNDARAASAIPVEVTVQNISRRNIELHLQGRDIVFDITVSNVDGMVVWRRLEGVAVQAILRLEPLAPDQVLTLRSAWPKEASAVPAGEYDVFASIPTDTLPLISPTVRFRVTN
jgi:hypothetical protein